jgi:AcrR family transcriptional regulator
VSELLDRRAQKKAQTRELIRGIAHRLFAERGFESVTIADVAREADVAVQTVFNHFATKEDLFFDGRVPWVEGPAAAVRSRQPSVPPLSALRAYVVAAVADLVSSMGTPERRSYITTLDESEALRAHEGELVQEAQRRLTAALLEAWAEDRAAGVPSTPVDPAMAASLTASVWLAAAKVLVSDQRRRVQAGECPHDLAARVTALLAEVLGDLEASAALTRGAPAQDGDVDTGWPGTVRRAG